MMRKSVYLNYGLDCMTANIIKKSSIMSICQIPITISL